MEGGGAALIASHSKAGMHRGELEEVSVDARPHPCPHPCPLPQGEGETSPALVGSSPCRVRVSRVRCRAPVARDLAARGAVWLPLLGERAGVRAVLPAHDSAPFRIDTAHRAANVARDHAPEEMAHRRGVRAAGGRGPVVGRPERREDGGEAGFSRIHEPAREVEPIQPDDDCGCHHGDEHKPNHGGDLSKRGEPLAGHSDKRRGGAARIRAGGRCRLSRTPSSG